jgi:hypothetical protein
MQIGLYCGNTFPFYVMDFDHRESRLSFSEAVKRGAFQAVDSAWSGT